MQHSHSLFAVLLVHNTYDIRLSNQGREKFFEKATENNFSKDTVFECYIKHERIQKT